MENSYRDRLISPSLKPLPSTLLEQKPSHLVYNAYYPLKVVNTDIPVPDDKVKVHCVTVMLETFALLQDASNDYCCSDSDVQDYGLTSC